MSHPYLSIVIPAYNESARIEATLERVMACVQTQSWDAEVLVVDDGSKDDTATIVERWMDRFPRLHLVKNPGNRGKGYSVRNGLLQAAGDVVMFTDADLSSPMEEGNRLLEALEAGADVAIGSRWMDRARQTIQQPLYRQFFGRCFNAITRGVMGLPFKDTQCGFKAFKRPARAGHLPPSADRALGLRPGDPVHCAQAEVLRRRGARDLGPRRAQPHELPEGRHEDARRDGGHPLQLAGRPLRPRYRGHDGHQRHGDQAGRTRGEGAVTLQ